MLPWRIIGCALWWKMRVSGKAAPSAPRTISSYARPAGLISAAARGFQAETAMAFRGTRANARSSVSLMGLGAQAGDTVTLTALGADAEAALDAIAALLAEGHGFEAAEHASPPAPAAP